MARGKLFKTGETATSLRVYKRWKEAEAVLRARGDEVGWFRTTLGECIEHTEGTGYWKSGTVREMLEKGKKVWTPFAEWRAFPEEVAQGTEQEVIAMLNRSIKRASNRPRVRYQFKTGVKEGEFYGRIAHTSRYEGEQLALVLFVGNTRVSRVPYDDLEFLD